MTSFGGFLGEMMHKNMNFIVLMHKFQLKLMNLCHIFD